MRVTKATLEKRIEILNLLTGLTFGIDENVGGLRIIKYQDETKSGGCSDISIRTTKKQIGEILSAMITVVMILEAK